MNGSSRTYSAAPGADPARRYQSQARVRFDESPEEPAAASLGDRLWGLVTAAIASVCLCGLLTMLCILYVSVRPFSEAMYRRLSAQMGWGSLLDAAALLLPNTTIYLTGDSDIPSLVGTSMLISNHLCPGDWWALLMLGRCVGLRGAVKVFLRNEYLQINMKDVVDNRNGTTTLATTTSPANRGSAENGSHGDTSSKREGASPDLSLMAKLLHLFLEFPLINGEDYMSDREHLFPLLRSFAQSSISGAPVHFVFFPEAWSLHNGANRQTLLAKSNEFAQKDGRPQLKHLLLPRTRGFNASVECLRESNPVVYDVTMAHKGYDGSLPQSMRLSSTTLWDLLLRRFPSEIHIRIKGYSMETVTQDTSWLDKKWQEKDRLLSHFVRHQSFPSEGQGYSRPRVFHTRSFAWESSVASLVRLFILPFCVPILIFLSIPVLWTLLAIWSVNTAFRYFFAETETSSTGNRSAADTSDTTEQAVTPSSAPTTPRVPTTPFGSPSLLPWFSKRDDSPPS